MNQPVRLDPAGAIAAHEWPPASQALFLSKSWFDLNKDVLRVQALHVVHAGNPAMWMVPVLEVDRASYRYFIPRDLLADLNRRVPRIDLAEFIESHVASRALVCAVPLAYASPLSGASIAAVRDVAIVIEKAAEERKLDVVAFLYLDASDADALAVLEGRGYLVTVLDGNAIIDIDRRWQDLPDYFDSQPNAPNLRRERRRFTEAGYSVEWHCGVQQNMVEDAVRLEGVLLRNKGHDYSDEELRKWYLGLSRLGESVLCCAASRNGVVEGFVLFVRDGDVLVGKAIGLEDGRANFLYFNIAYYEPIRYAIAHRVKTLNLGPSTADAKRRRGARGRALLGAFRFPDPEVRNRWSEISAVLKKHFSSAWSI